MHFVAAGIAAAAFALMLKRPTSTFTWSPTPLTPTINVPRAGVVEPPVQRGAAGFRAQEGSTPTGAGWRYLGCVTLLLASAVRSLPRGHGGGQRSRRCVVACRAAPSSLPRPRAELSMQHALAASGAAIPAVLSAVTKQPVSSAGTLTPPAPVPPVYSLTLTAAPAIFAGVSLDAIPEEASTPAANGGRAAAAHRTGSTWRARARTRRATRRAGAAERHARRSSGARLQATRVAEEQPASFDPSCLRTKIQRGLRTTSRIGLARGRESKTPAASKASSESAGVYLKANHFEARFEDEVHP